MGTGRVPKHMWAPEGCPGTYGHQNGARINIGTRRVHGHIWKPEWSPGTYVHRKGARAHKYRAHVDTGKNARANIDTVKSTR